MKFTNTVTIERPIHEVFAFLADIENVPKWNYAISETRKATDGPVGVGTQYLQVRTIPTHSEETIEITELEPDRKLGIRGDLGPFEAELTYDLEPVPEGTRVTNDAILEAAGMTKLAAPLARGRIRDGVAENLNVLKRMLEAG